VLILRRETYREGMNGVTLQTCILTFCLMTYYFDNWAQNERDGHFKTVIRHTLMSLLPPFCVKSWNHGHVSLQCLYAGLTNCRLFTASCLVALVFLWDLLLSTMPPSHVKLRETCWEILTQGTACQDASPCQEEQVSYDPGFPKQTHDERLALNERWY